MTSKGNGAGDGDTTASRPLHRTGVGLRRMPNEINDWPAAGATAITWNESDPVARNRR